MNDTLHEYLDVFVIVYLNDILIYLKNEIKHTKYVRLILEKLRTKRLLLKQEKCEFSKEQVKFLSYIISSHRIKMD